MDSRFYINGVELDLNESIAVPMSFSIADIKDPEKRKRNYTKEIKLPATKRNKSFFSSTYQLSYSAIDNNTVSFDFDPTNVNPAKYVENGVVRFIGMVRLLNITIENKVMTFNVALFSNYVELYRTLGDIKVSELGWSKYDHTLSIANIQNSWDTSVYQDGAPVSNFTAGVPDGFGYLYLLCDYGLAANPRDVFTNEIFPHVYWKEIIEKCFDKAGFTITGDFIDSERLKKLVFGYGGGQKVGLNPTEVASRRARYSATGSFSESINYSYYQLLGSTYFYTYNYVKRLKLYDSFWSTTTLVADGLGQFDETSGQLTIVKQGNYSLLFSGDVVHTMPSDLSGNLTVQLLKNGIPVHTFLQTSLNGTFVVSSKADISCFTGDILEIEFVIGVNRTIATTQIPSDRTPYTIGVSDSGGWSFDLTSVGGNIIDGDTVTLSNFIPEMKASDFLNGVILAFNLYVSDPDTDGQVLIEPLDDYYYNSDQFDDITQLIDHERTIKIMPSANIKGKNYIFKFVEDNDYYNKFYRDKYGVNYGEKVFVVPSTFEKSDRVYQLPFAQTVPVGIPGTNIVIPSIVSIDEVTQAVTPYKGKPRVYFYSGLRSSDSWVLRNSATPTISSTFTSYPCANHLDDVDNPTFDLNFELPQELFWSNANYTTDNLWSEYNEKFVREATGKDSKIVTVYCKKDPDLVALDSFRKFAMINGVLFRKNAIEEYNGNGQQPFVFELARIVEGSKRRSFLIGIGESQGNIIKQSGGTDIDGADTGVGVVFGEADSVQVTSNVKYG